jgi:hypothetical protein
VTFVTVDFVKMKPAPSTPCRIRDDMHKKEKSRQADAGRL